MTSTASAFSTLAVPAPDDTMDMSSPANRPLDDDIDIDFDDYPPGPTAFAEDDQMLEDTTRPPTATDEVMGDDLHHENQVTVTEHEEVMQDHDEGAPDETVTTYDEELIDYGEDDDAFHDDVHPQNEIPNATDTLFPSSNVADESTTHDFDEAIESHVEEADVTLTGPTEIEVVEPQHPHSDAPELTADTVDAIAEAGLETYLEQDAAGPAVEEAVHDEYEKQYEDQLTDPTAQDEHPPITVDTTATATTDAPDTPTDTGMHPMTVRYHDMLLPLFKSKRQLDGLLKSDNLASVSLSSLAEDCRKQLGKRDYTISEDQDIVLNFDQLGLTLIEDCHAAFDTSLEEILQVYLHLHHNEGWQEIAPLSLILSTQLKFSSSFTFLKNAAELGQGISQFSFMQNNPDNGEHEENFEEEAEVEENALHEDNQYADEDEYDETAQLEHEESAEQTIEEEYEHNPDGHQDHEAFDDGIAQDDFQGETVDTLNDLTGASTKDIDAVDEQDAAEDQGTVSQHQPAENQDTSPASSHTAQGDHEANSTTNTNIVATTSPGRNDQPQHVEHEDQSGLENDQHLTSDDWLNEDADEQQHHHHPSHEENEGLQYDTTEGQHEEEYEEWTQEGGEEQYDQEYPSELVDEEQYHTAHEGLFDGQSYEHGLEHTDFHHDEEENANEPAPIGEEEEEEEYDDTVIIHPQPEGEEGDDEYHHEEVQEQHVVHDIEDEINFDDDEDNEPVIVEAEAATATSSSLRGKRSFDEIDDLDDDDTAALDLPDIKKVRSS